MVLFIPESLALIHRNNHTKDINIQYKLPKVFAFEFEINQKVKVVDFHHS